MSTQPPYSCILDGVQFVQINPSVNDASMLAGSMRSSMDSQELLHNKAQVLTLKFHYTRRMAGILREEAERERQIQMDLETLRQEKEDAHNKKYAIVERIKMEMAAKDAA